MREKNLKTPVQEWQYLLSAEDVGQKPLKLKIVPDLAQKKALSKRFGIVSIEKLEAEMEITRNRGNMVVHVQGHIKAQLTQKCVISLEPVEETIEEDFEGWFADPSQAVSFAKAKRERMNPQELIEQPILEEQEDPEPIIDGKIDLGEFVTQYFSLALNPYPRAVDSDYGNIKDGSKAELGLGYENPFAALKEWKAREQKKDKQ